MPDWDTTLKLLIAESADHVLPMLGITAGVNRWLNVELPKTQNLRVDLLAELESGELSHIELQSTNLQKMPFRMLEYAVAICRCQRRFPVQTVVYVGNKPLHMKNYFRKPGLDFRFEMIDLKTLDGTALLESEKLSDNLMALLMALKDKREAIRRIVGRINRLDEGKRKDALHRLLLTCGMRMLETDAVEEMKKMSVKTLLKEDPYIANLIREGREDGRKGLVRLQLQKKFGALPSWVDERLSACSSKQIDTLALKILDSPTLEQLFRRK